MKILRDVCVLLWPVGLWLILMNAINFVPAYDLPEIDTTTLPGIDRMLTGKSFIFHIFSYETPFWAVIASIPYLLHFFLVFIFVFMIKKSSKCRLIKWWHIKCFIWSFVILNLMGVLTQLYFPTAPPWWYELRLDEASYEVKGHRAVLGEVDKLLPFPIFEKIYGQSPIVFGSFPSLHASWPLHIAVYTWKNGKFFKMFWVVYICWIWWAAIYLKHHFLIDIIGAVLYVVITQILSRGLFKKPHCDTHKLRLPDATKYSDFHKYRSCEEGDTREEIKQV